MVSKLVQVLELAASRFPLDGLLSGSLALCMTSGKETSFVACKTVVL